MASNDVSTEAVATEASFVELTPTHSKVSSGAFAYDDDDDRNRNRKFLISRAPTKAKSQEPIYSQALKQNKIDRR